MYARASFHPVMGRYEASWLLALALLAGAWTSVAVAQQPDPMGVAGVHLSYGDDPATQMTVTWTGPPGQTGQLEVGEGEELDQSFDATMELPQGSTRAVYHATAVDLSPRTTYNYRALAGPAASEIHSFTTAPPAGTEANLTITAFADHGTVHPANTRADGDNPQRVTELGAEQDPTFHLHSGDTSYAEGDAHQWNLYLDQIGPMATKAPYMTVPGNHEREEPQGFSQYDARFKMPTGEEGRWWSFQYGNVLVVGINSERTCMAQDASTASATGDEADDCETSSQIDPYEPQLAFVEATLATAAEDPSIDWRILFSHHLFWSSSVHAGAKGLKEHYMPLLDEYNVDVVLQGHDHVYERSKILADSDLTTTGTLYLTNGAAGSGNYDWAGDQPQWSAVRDNEHYGSIVLDIEGDRLDGSFVSLEEGAIDTFTVTNVEDDGVRMGPPDGASSSAGQEDEQRGDGDGSFSVPAPGLATMLATLALALIATARRR